MEIAGLAIAGLAGVAIFVIGVCYLLSPRSMATSFGLPCAPQESATPWLRVKGVRDAVTGIVAAVLLIAAEPTVVAWCVLAFALIPAGDAALVLSSRGSKLAGWGIHGGTAALMLVGVGLILGAV